MYSIEIPDISHEASHQKPRSVAYLNILACHFGIVCVRHEFYAFCCNQFYRNDLRKHQLPFMNEKVTYDRVALKVRATLNDSG
jgi:hypothetical protein